MTTLSPEVKCGRRLCDRQLLSTVIRVWTLSTGARKSPKVAEYRYRGELLELDAVHRRLGVEECR
jgi:hypothetical protein